jgi:hypothetical protein
VDRYAGAVKGGRRVKSGRRGIKGRAGKKVSGGETGGIIASDAQRRGIMRFGDLMTLHGAGIRRGENSGFKFLFFLMSGGLCVCLSLQACA